MVGSHVYASGPWVPGLGATWLSAMPFCPPSPATLLQLRSAVRCTMHTVLCVLPKTPSDYCQSYYGHFLALAGSRRFTPTHRPSQISHRPPSHWPALKIQKPRTRPSRVCRMLWHPFPEAINTTRPAAERRRRWSQCTNKCVGFSSTPRPELIFQSVSLPCAKHGVGASLLIPLQSAEFSVSVWSSSAL